MKILQKVQKNLHRPNVEFHIYCKFPENFSLPDRSYVIAGLDPAISPAKGIPASERGNDIVSYKSKLGLHRLPPYQSLSVA